MIPVYVPSKGRVETSATLRALESESYPDVRVIVPPAEVDTYAARWKAQSGGTATSGWHVSAQRGTGIQGARQTILEDARWSGDRNVWMLDDDISAVLRRKALPPGYGFERVTFEQAFDAMVTTVALDGPDLVNGYEIALAGPQFRQYAWSGPDVAVDVHLRNFILLDTAAPIEYPEYLKEDLDVVLQAITKGWHTLRFSSYAFTSPTMGTLDGGCSDDYADGLLEDATARIANRWPGIVTVVHDKKLDKFVNRVNWRKAREIGRSRT